MLDFFFCLSKIIQMKKNKDQIIIELNNFISEHSRLPTKIELDTLPYLTRAKVVTKILGKRNEWNFSGVHVPVKHVGNCAVCSKELDKKKKQTKFCSHVCLTKSKTKYKTCINCQKELYRGKLYCSTSCSVSHKKLSAKEIFEANQPNNFGPLILKRLLKESCGHRCSNCKNTEWLGQPIPLELEHIDGNSQNNKKENLCLLCPNCHTFTPTYKAKNKGNGRAFRRQRYAEGKSY